MEPIAAYIVLSLLPTKKTKIMRKKLTDQELLVLRGLSYDEQTKKIKGYAIGSNVSTQKFTTLLNGIASKGAIKVENGKMYITETGIAARPK